MMACLALSCSRDPRTAATAVSVIPEPVSLVATGGYFLLDQGTGLSFDHHSADVSGVAGVFREDLSRYPLEGFPFKDAPAEGGRNSITLEIVPDTALHREGYRMSVNKRSIRITAPGKEGLYYGLQTLRQILMTTTPSKGAIRIPCMEITDYPRFSWRGMHLDVSRHFFAADSIKRYIDFLALYKFNRFHWHLTDDQGWRIEIRKYPKLTTTGAWRKPRQTGAGAGSGKTEPEKLYGGFYTQEEIRQIVAYASERMITVVPEIEMPGHSQAAIAAYPELGVTGRKVEVKSNWGISPVIYNPSEPAFRFLEDVLDEVMTLFPSPYIHIGGDEAIKDQWKASQEVQKLIRKNGLRDEDQLQSWFIGRIEKYLEAHGRKLIGWDEILEGGLSPGATVMSWRGEEGGIRAARLGHDVIMTPNSSLYLNFSQTENEPTSWAKRHVTHLSDVYAYEPCNPELTPAEQRFILGAQGCVWTEHIATFRRLEHMIFPRITALSEVVWSPADKRDFKSYGERLYHQKTLFEQMDIRYCSDEIENFTHSDAKP